MAILQASQVADFAIAAVPDGVHTTTLRPLCQMKRAGVQVNKALINALNASHYTVVIEGTLPSLNQYVDACRRNRYAGAKMKQAAENIICAFIKNQLGGVTIDSPVAVSIAWYEPNRKKDPDNVAFAKKFLLDSLVQCGVLKNDSQQYIVRLSDSFYVDKNNPRIEVTLREVKSD